MANHAIRCVYAAKLDGEVKNPGAKAVFASLADRGNAVALEDWSCFPSMETIADELDMGVRTVERHLAWLEEKGWIRRQRLRWKAGKRKGQLAGYRYRLNRTRLEKALADKLAEEAQARAGMLFATEPADWDDAEPFAAEPAANLAGGPPATVTEASRQSGAEPPANLAGHEPKLEPSEEPSERGRAGERVDRWAKFWKAEALYPTAGKGGFNETRSKAAWRVLVDDQGIAEDRLVEAARRCGEDPTIKADQRYFAFQTWLAEGWRAYDPDRDGARGAAMAAVTGGVAFAGPDWLAEKIIAEAGLDWFRTWIAAALAWSPAADGKGGVLTLRAFTLKRIGEDRPAVLGWLKKELGVTVVSPEQAQAA